MLVHITTISSSTRAPFLTLMHRSVWIVVEAQGPFTTRAKEEVRKGLELIVHFCLSIHTVVSTLLLS